MSWRDEYDQAARLFRSFTGLEPDPERFIELQAPRVPRVAVNVGTCDGIMYSTTRDEGRGPELQKYIHRFRASDRPLFVVSPRGEQLFLIGGRFRFTERGIVDATDRSAR